MHGSAKFVPGRYISTVPSARIFIEYLPRGYSDMEPLGRGRILPTQVPTSSSGTAPADLVAAGVTCFAGDEASEPHPAQTSIPAASASARLHVLSNIRVMKTPPGSLRRVLHQEVTPVKSCAARRN